MRKYIAVLFTALLCFAASCALADGIITLPASLKEVQASAFYGDQALDAVMLPDGVETIGAKAFAGSTVSIIRLPESLKSIDDSAFDGCDGLMAVVSADSYAYDWCAENGVACQPETQLSDFTYTATKKAVSITGYTGESGVVIVPSSIEGKPVTSVSLANNQTVNHRPSRSYSAHLPS